MRWGGGRPPERQRNVPKSGVEGHFAEGTCPIRGHGQDRESSSHRALTLFRTAQISIPVAIQQNLECCLGLLTATACVRKQCQPETLAILTLYPK